MTFGRAWALSLALLLAQALGLHHGVAHGAASAQGLGGQAQAEVFVWVLAEHHGAHHHGAQAPVQQAASPGALHDDHAAGDAQCRLVDQLGHAEFLWLACTVAPLVPADRLACRRAVPGTATAAAIAPYLARGPP